MSNILFHITQSLVSIVSFFQKRWIDFRYFLQRHGGPKVELPPGVIEVYKMVGALSDLEEKFNLKRQSSKATALYACLIHNDFPDEVSQSMGALMYSATNKRRAVYNVMLHYKDILPHQVNYLFPGEERAKFEAWLDVT